MIEIKEMLFRVGKKNEVIDAGLSWEKAQKRMESECIEDPSASFQKIRDAVLGLGTILEENPEEAYYLTTVNIGATAAVLIAIAFDGGVETAAYAEEGLIRQHLAQKAIEAFRKRMLSLRSYSQTGQD